MKNIVGQAVSGRDFFPRPREERKLRFALREQGHILLLAPRRIGKTSLLYRLQDEAKETDPLQFLWVITESVRSEDDFFQRLHSLLADDQLSDYQRVTRGATRVIKDAVSHLGSLEAGGFGFELKEGNKTPYLDRFKALVRKLNLKPPHKIVIMIDEFPTTVENIRAEHGDRAAVHFLQVNRELRQSQGFSDKIQFIYTGSIGLEPVVSQLRQMNLINDLTPIEMKPMKPEEARELLLRLAESVPFRLTPPCIDEMLRRIEWHIPFFLQLLFHELKQICIEEDLDTAEPRHVATAFDNMLSRPSHFRHWEDRLAKALDGNSRIFARKLLRHIAENQPVAPPKVYELAREHKAEEGYMVVVDTLRHDGYIQDQEGGYRFISPVLAAWWRKYGSL